MTENEAIERIRDHFEVHHHDDRPHPLLDEAVDMAINALEEVQQYRAIGTPEELKAAMKYVYLAKKHGTVGQVIENCVKYEAIGTPEECKAAVEKQTAISREIIEGKYFCPKCHNLMPYPGYCGCGQKVY